MKIDQDALCHSSSDAIAQRLWEIAATTYCTHRRIHPLTHSKDTCCRRECERQSWIPIRAQPSRTLAWNTPFHKASEPVCSMRTILSADQCRHSWSGAIRPLYPGSAKGVFDIRMSHDVLWRTSGNLYPSSLNRSSLSTHGRESGILLCCTLAHIPTTPYRRMRTIPGRAA